MDNRIANQGTGTVFYKEHSCTKKIGAPAPCSQTGLIKPHGAENAKMILYV